MGRQSWKIRSSMNTKALLLLLAVGLSLSVPFAASATELRAFTAQYKVYKGGVQIANSELSLKHSNELWSWRLSTKARGLYALFTRKNPYSETTFFLEGDLPRLHNILVTDRSDEKEYESARFDWESGKIEVLRKNKQQQLIISETVYDYQSIHLLAASMTRQQQTSRTVSFYRNGNLSISLLEYIGRSGFELNGREIMVDQYSQTISDSDSTIKYSYDSENPTLPVRVEHIKKDGSSSILLLQRVDWQL